MKRKPILIAITALLLLFMAGSAYVWLTIPKTIEANIHKAFAHAGFENITLPEPEKRFGQMRYSNIQLDEDSFSTIKTLTLSYSVLSAIFGSALDTLSVSGMDLTGELDSNNEISIAGWNGQNKEITQDWPMTARVVQFEDSRLSLLSETWGGISLSGDAQLRPSRKNIGFEARIEGVQKQLSAQTQIEGQITPEGFWQGRIELEQGKLELDQIRATRLAGVINVSGQGKHTSQVLGELQAGGLNILGLPWQNAAITIDGEPAAPRAIIAAKSAGFDGLELGITVPDINAPTMLNGQIHIDTLGTAFDYLQSQNQLPVERTLLTDLDGMNDITMHFMNRNEFIFNIKKEEKNIDIKGKIESSRQGSKLVFSSAPIPLQKLSKSTNERGSVHLKGAATRTAGETQAIAAVTLKEAALGASPLPITIPEGVFEINDIKTLSGSVNKEQTCRITGFKTKTTCTIDLQIKNAKPDFSNLEIKGAGFDIYTPAPPKDNKSLLTIREIDIDALLKLFKNKDWQGTGYFDGTVALVQDVDALKVNSLHLKNKGVGILKLKDDALFELMNMEELEKETMKLALENFHYDLMEIKAEGTLPDQVKISVFGKGKNPYLMQGRQFSIDFEVTPDLGLVGNLLFETPQ